MFDGTVGCHTFLAARQAFHVTGINEVSSANLSRVAFLLLGGMAISNQTCVVV